MSARAPIIRLLLIEDHAIVRAGLRYVLDRDDIRVCGEATNVAGALQCLSSERYDVVLLDIGLGEESGLPLLKTIKAQWPETQVLILSAYCEREYGEEVMDGGAAGFVSKQSDSEQLVSAIRAAAAGRRDASPGLAQESVCAANARGGTLPQVRLSGREFEVLRLLAAGSTVTEIARYLELSVKTVSTYRVRIMEKAGLRNNVELISFALQAQNEGSDHQA